MALIICEECKSTISDKASSCPSCGYPLLKSLPLKAPKMAPPVGNFRHRETERFMTASDEADIRKIIADKLKTIDPNFDEELLIAKRANSIIVKVNISKNGQDCLVTVDHNLHKNPLSGVAEAIFILLLIILTF